MICSMPVTLTKCPAFADRRGPLLRLVLFALAAFLFLLTLSQEVGAQTNMTLGQLMPNLIRNTSQVVTASSSGLQVAEAGSVAIGSGSSMVGQVAINELRVIPLARIAARAVTGATPVMLAALAADLISYGITQCAQGTIGWCKPGQVNANQSDTGFNGYQWRTGVPDGSGTQYYGDSPTSAVLGAGSYAGATIVSCTQSSPTQWNCVMKKADNSQYGAGVTQVSTCVKNYIVINGVCKPDPNANVSPQPATYPDLANNLSQVLSGNPNRAKDYWGFMPWTDQLAALADPQTQALPAQVGSPSTVTGPTTTTQTPAGTTTSKTSCTVSPNTDSTTLASNPVSVACTTTTTNPDGTTTTTTTTTNPTTGDGSTPQPASSPAANPLPASSPIPCGLGTSGSPKCKIDETGTPTDSTQVQTDTKTKLDTADATLKSGLGSITGSGKPDTTITGILPTFTGQCRTASFQVTLPMGVITQVVDPCPNWNYIQFVMSFVWVVATVLGSIAMVKQTIDGG